jgi:hypothetical protein
MAKYMILYCSSESARDMMTNATPEQMKAGMDAWMTWAGKAPTAHATHAGPGSLPGAEEITGYSILQADSTAAVTAVLDGHPHLDMPGNTIEVLEMLPMPGM